jgi:hypothetical protein
MKNNWIEIGSAQLDKKEVAFIILAFDQLEKEIRNEIRIFSLRWNKFRSKWYIAITELTALRSV